MLPTPVPLWLFHLNIRKLHLISFRLLSRISERMGSQNLSEESLAGLIEEIQRTEIEARKLHRDVKNVLKAFSDLEKCDRRIAINLKKSPLCGVGKVSDHQIRNSVMTWLTTADQVEKLEKICATDTTDLCLKPLKEYLQVVSSHHVGLRKREHALQEHARALARWRKVEKDGKFSVTTIKLTELRNHLTDTEVAVDALNAAVSGDIAGHNSQSPEFFRLLFQLLSQTQGKYYSKSYKQMMNGSAAQPNGVISDTSLQDQMTGFQRELSSLSIVDKS